MILDGFIFVLQLENVLALIFGTVIGIVLGILPGIGPTVAIALLLPLTFGWNPTAALVLMGAVYNSAVYGGSISAILLNVPGTGPSAATLFDGYPMAEKGLANVALGASATASAGGGIIGVIILIFSAPLIADFAVKFGPPETSLLAILALSIIAVVERGSTVKGLISGCLGLTLATFGYDIISGDLRFTFDTYYLRDGIPLIPTAVGLFAISQALRLGASGETIAKLSELKGKFLDGSKSLFQYPVTFFRSSAIGTFIGALPGAGGVTASFLAYAEAIRGSKTPEAFGKGHIEGVIAPEAANNACVMGSLIPTLALGIPGSEACALFLATMIFHGLAPGPLVFTRDAETIYTLFACLIITNFAIFSVGATCGRYFAKVTLVPNRIIVPLIISISLIGSYILRRTILDVILASTFGFIGFIMRERGYGLVPFILGLILGPIAERGFRQALLMSEGSYAIFVESIIAKVLVAVIVVALCFPVVRGAAKRISYKRSSSRS